MRALARRRTVTVVIGLFVLLAAGTVALLNPRVTRYVESDAFRAELEKETAKGLHFPAGNYSPIRRTGFLLATSAGFQARNGRKALTAIDARSEEHTSELQSRLHLVC